MWEERLQELLRFRDVHGHVDVPRGWLENPALSYWVINQRRQLRRGTLSPERVQALEHHGIRWRSAADRSRERDRRWMRMCDALEAFLRRRGHCDVPDGWPEHPELARWVLRQRYLQRTGGLREDRARILEERGIDWLPQRGFSRSRARAWEGKFNALRQQGLTNIAGAPRPLVRWVSRQRLLLRKGSLREDRRLRLEELGLKPAAPPDRSGSRSRLRRSSGVRDRAWREKYDRLLRFHEQHGHCDLPRRHPEDPELARWVCHQRERYRSGRLTQEQAALLGGIRFSWSNPRPRSAWDRAYSKLVAYRLAHGDCEVPSCFAEDRALGRWVAAQRSLRRRGLLHPERARRLTRLGFDWHVSQARPSRAAF